MNGHRVGREERKGPGWKKPGARRAEEKAMQASGNMPLEKPTAAGKDNDLVVTTAATPSVGDVVLVVGTVQRDKDLGSGWFKCRKDGCRRRFFIRSRS